MKALRVFVEGGPPAVGVMAAGFEIDAVLELNDSMKQTNGFHFVKNFPHIQHVDRSDWESSNFLTTLNNGKDYDYAFLVPPCSSLSLLNTHARADAPGNEYFYHAANILLSLPRPPRAFALENAPALLSIGYPVLQKFIGLLKDVYRFTVIRDYAGDHDVPMPRQRTMIVGWRRDGFSGVPQIYMKNRPMVTVRDILGDCVELKGSNLPNHSEEWIVTDAYMESMKPLLKRAAELKKRITETAAIDYERLTEEGFQWASPGAERAVLRVKDKSSKNQGYWDKSAQPTYWNKQAPSMTSITRNIHPDAERYWTTREYARCMTLPDDFIFYEGGKVPTVQCMAQAVPSNFVKWISEEVKRNLEGDVVIHSTKDIVFQHHTAKLWEEFDYEDLGQYTSMSTSKNARKLQDPVGGESVLDLF